MPDDEAHLEGGDLLGSNKWRICDGNLLCDVLGCDQPAVGFTGEGDALCEDCMAEWISKETIFGKFT